MTLLAWTDDLTTHHPQMDDTHREFVELLDRVHAAQAAPFEDLLAAYDALQAHTVEHFAQEDRWMVATGFAPENCHSLQHRQVLAVLDEVRRRMVDDPAQRTLVAELLPGLVQWFEQHAPAADHGLAMHLAEVGYDTITGTLRQAVAEGAVSGCGSAACAS
jgi:hemerythrin-like metal-binding protein